MNTDIKKHKFIVFCSDHYNPLGICRSLGEVGIAPIVVLVGEKKSLINHCKYVKTLFRVNSNEEGLQLIIEKYGLENRKSFILTGSDDTTRLLDLHYDKLKDKFFFFNGGAQGVITQYMDKETICNIAEECGIPKPQGEILKRGQLPRKLTYPIITKVTMSIKGAWKNDVHICQNEHELIEAWPKIKADEILAQEFIEKKNELCVDGISINGGEEVWFPNTSEYIRFTKDGYGNYMWIKPYKNNVVHKKIQNILKKTRFSGIFSLECLIDKNDNLYFLEVNFRNSTWSYAYTYAGLNLPYQWAKATLDGYIDYDNVNVLTDPFTVMAELNDFIDCRTFHKIGFMKWFSEFRKCDCTLLYNKKDPMPFWNAVIGFAQSLIIQYSYKLKQRLKSKF